MSNKILVDLETRHNGNPDNGLPLGPCGFTAMALPYRSGWRGCPMGRASTREGALRDLLLRANQESGTSFTLDDLEVRDRTG